MKNWIIAALVAVIAIGGAIGAFAATRTVETKSSVDVRVWQNVEDPSRIHLSTRPEGGRWVTHDTPVDMSGRSGSGLWRRSNVLTFDVPVRITAPALTPLTHLSGTGPRIVPVDFDENLQVCNYTLEGNEADSWVTVKLFWVAGETPGAYLLMVSERAERGTWERVVHRREGGYLVEIATKQDAQWTFTCTGVGAES
ncbi:MAG: hypothetical protein OXS47_13195 [Chloroflexota bacterium]|nr:hypothetical protein [Chloroflexota bacterium]